MKFTPRSSALCTTRAEASKSIRPPKLLAPSPTTETSSVELPSLRLCILDDLLDAVRLRGADNGVEHGHAMQDVRNRNGIVALLADGARERGELGMEHVKSGMLDDFVRRRRDSSARRLRRARHEPERLETGPRNLGEASGPIKTESEARRGRNRAEDEPGRSTLERQHDGRR